MNNFLAFFLWQRFFERRHSTLDPSSVLHSTLYLNHAYEEQGTKKKGEKKKTSLEYICHRVQITRGIYLYIVTSLGCQHLHCLSLWLYWKADDLSERLVLPDTKSLNIFTPWGHWRFCPAFFFLFKERLLRHKCTKVLFEVLWVGDLSLCMLMSWSLENWTN